MIKQVTVLDDKVLKEIVAKLEHGEYRIENFEKDTQVDMFGDTIYMGYSKSKVTLKIGKYVMTIEG